MRDRTSALNRFASIRFEDISIDSVRDELLFGISESVVRDCTVPTGKDREGTDRDNRLVNSNTTVGTHTHDETAPHVHYVLLGIEFTVHLPLDAVVPTEIADDTECSSTLAIVRSAGASECTSMINTSHISNQSISQTKSPTVRSCNVGKLALEFSNISFAKEHFP